MEVLQYQEHETDGHSVQFDDGTRKFWYHLPNDASVDDARAAELRNAVKSQQPKPLKDIIAEREKAADEMRAKNAASKIARINASLKELGAREITTLEEIPNAKAFITIKRAQIFEDNEGA